MAASLSDTRWYVTTTVPESTGSPRTIRELWRGAYFHVWRVQTSLEAGALRSDLAFAVVDNEGFSAVRIGDLLYLRALSRPDVGQYFATPCRLGGQEQAALVTVAGASGDRFVVVTTGFDLEQGGTYWRIIWNTVSDTGRQPLGNARLRQGLVCFGSGGVAAVFMRTDANTWLKYTRDFGRTWLDVATFPQRGTRSPLLNFWLAITESSVLYFGHPRATVRTADESTWVRRLDLRLGGVPSAVAIPQLDGKAVLSGSGSPETNRLVLSAYDAASHHVLLFHNGEFRASAANRTAGAVSPNGRLYTYRALGSDQPAISDWPY